MTHSLSSRGPLMSLYAISTFRTAPFFCSLGLPRQTRLTAGKSTIQLLDHLRTTHPANFDIANVSSDLIDFLIGIDFLPDRAQLLSSYVANASPPAAHSCLSSLLGVLKQINNRADLLMSSCPVRVICLGYLMQPQFAVVTTVWLGFPFLLLISADRPSFQNTIPGLM